MCAQFPPSPPAPLLELTEPPLLLALLEPPPLLELLELPPLELLAPPLLLALLELPLLELLDPPPLELLAPPLLLALLEPPPLLEVPEPPLPLEPLPASKPVSPPPADEPQAERQNDINPMARQGAAEIRRLQVFMFVLAHISVGFRWLRSNSPLGISVWKIWLEKVHAAQHPLIDVDLAVRGAGSSARAVAVGVDVLGNQVIELGPQREATHFVADHSSDHRAG